VVFKLFALEVHCEIALARAMKAQTCPVGQEREGDASSWQEITWHNVNCLSIFVVARQ
jgi:hypothetical protein